MYWMPVCESQHMSSSGLGHWSCTGTSYGCSQTRTYFPPETLTGCAILGTLILAFLMLYLRASTCPLVNVLSTGICHCEITAKVSIGSKAARKSVRRCHQSCMTCSDGVAVGWGCRWYTSAIATFQMLWYPIPFNSDNSQIRIASSVSKIQQAFILVLDGAGIHRQIYAGLADSLADRAVY